MLERRGPGQREQTTLVGARAAAQRLAVSVAACCSAFSPRSSLFSPEGSKPESPGKRPSHQRARRPSPFLLSPKGREAGKGQRTLPSAGILTSFPFLLRPRLSRTRPLQPPRLGVRTDSLASHHASRENLLFLSRGNSHSTLCYSHQDLHRRPLHRPSQAGSPAFRAALSFFPPPKGMKAETAAQ